MKFLNNWQCSEIYRQTHWFFSFSDCSVYEISNPWWTLLSCITWLRILYSGLPWWLSGKDPPVYAETWVWSLIQDPACHRAAKPVYHESWAGALEPTGELLSPRAAAAAARVPLLLKPVCHHCWSPPPAAAEAREPYRVLCNSRSHCNKKPAHP